MPPKKKRKPVDHLVDNFVQFLRHLPEGVNITQTDYYQDFIRDILIITSSYQDDQQVKSKIDRFIADKGLLSADGDFDAEHLAGEIESFVKTTIMKRPEDSRFEFKSTGPAPRLPLLGKTKNRKIRGKSDKQESKRRY